MKETLKYLKDIKLSDFTKESREKVKSKKIKLIIIICFIILFVDQLSKIFVEKFASSRIGWNYLAIEKVTNEGMAFGFNNGNTKNIFMTIFVIGIILNFISKQINQIDNKTASILGLILGGGISNLIDRFIRHGVLDFIRVGYFFTCNIADVSIFIGWILLIIFIIFFSNNNKVDNAEISGDKKEKHFERKD